MHFKEQLSNCVAGMHFYVSARQGTFHNASHSSVQIQVIYSLSFKRSVIQWGSNPRPPDSHSSHPIHAFFCFSFQATTLRQTCSKEHSQLRVKLGGAQCTDLQSAAYEDCVICVKTLCSKGTGVDLDASDDDGRTTLHWAAHLGSVGCIQELLEAGANRNAKDNHGETALYFQWWTVSYFPLLFSILQKQIFPSEVEGHIKCIELLINAGVETTTKDDAAMVTSDVSTPVLAVEVLVASGVDVNISRSMYPLLLAERGDDVEGVKVLLRVGADVNCNNKKFSALSAVAGLDDHQKSNGMHPALAGSWGGCQPMWNRSE